MSTTTQTELARRLGISRSTVAAALNPNSPVKLRESTRELVEKEAAKLNYRPNHHALLMRGGKSGIIGIFQFGGLSQVAAERARHASKVIEDAGYKILSTDLSWSPGGAKAGCEAMLDARVEGVLVAGLNDPSSIVELKAIQKKGVPMVSLSGNELKGVPHIRADANLAMREMTQHLLQLGRRRLLFLMHHSADFLPGVYIWAFTERLTGFKGALESVSGRIVEAFSDSPRAGVQGRVLTSNAPVDIFDPYLTSKAIMEGILKEDCLPDAVLCGNDDWAIGAMAAVREAGLRVPRDIAITGYDNTSQGKYLDVSLTTVAQPSQAMAERAVQILVGLIQKKKKARLPHITQFPCKLIIRQSSLRPRKGGT